MSGFRVRREEMRPYLKVRAYEYDICLPVR
jgi:hypothetical protein